MNKNDFNWYREIGFADTVVNTAEDIASRVESYYEMKFDEIFISNIQNDNHEEYPSLWMFTEQDAVECKNFLTRFDIDVVKYKGNVRYVNIITDDKETLNTPSSTSTMKLAVSLSDDVKCIFDAKGLNCKKLSGIAKRYLKEYKSGR